MTQRYDLEILIRTRKTGAGVQQADREVNKLGGTIKTVLGAAGIGLGADYAIRAVADFVDSSNKEFADFERGANEVFTLLPGLSEKAKQEMNADILEYSREVGRVTDESIPALYQAISAGVPQDNVFDFMRVASDAALGGVTELETAVDGISSVTNAYGREVVSAQQASDLLFTAVKGGKTDFEQLSRFMFQVVPTAAALNVEFGNVTAAMAAITAQGTPTRVAATQIRQVLIELSKQGGAAANTFERVAGKSFRQFIAEGGNLQEALQLMEQEAQRTDIGINDLFGSVEAGNAALQLTGKGTEKFTEQLKEAENAVGATDEAAETMSGTMEHLEGRAEAATEAFKIQRGEALEPLRRAYLEAKIEAVDYAAAIFAVQAAQDEGSITNLEAARLIRDLKFNIRDEAEVMEELRILTLATTDVTEEVTAKKYGSSEAAAANRTSIEAETEAIVKQRQALADLEDQQEDESAALTGQARLHAQAVRVRDAQAKAAEETAERMAELNEQQKANNELVQQQQVHLTNLFRNTERPVADLLQAQADLDEAQGRWVQTTRDRSEEIAEINQQLARDLTSEQQDAYRDIVGEVEEGSAEWLNAYNALQNDLTESQRAALVAQRADLQSAHGEVLSVYTGDARGAEEAQKRIEQANAAIVQSYKKAAFEQTLAQTGVTEKTLQLGVQLGVITQQEADLRLEMTRRMSAIEELTALEQFQKSTTEDQVEAVDRLIESENLSAEAALNHAQQIEGELTPAMADSEDQAGRLIDRLDEMDGRTVTVMFQSDLSQWDVPEQAADWQATTGGGQGGERQQHGGIIGGSGGVDSVRARLTPGEGVLPVNAMRQIGRTAFEQLRQGNTAGLGSAYYDQRVITQNFRSREAAALGLGLVQIERRKRIDRVMGGA